MYHIITYRCKLQSLPEQFLLAEAKTPVIWQLSQNAVTSR